MTTDQLDQHDCSAKLLNKMQTAQVLMLVQQHLLLVLCRGTNCQVTSVRKSCGTNTPVLYHVQLAAAPAPPQAAAALTDIYYSGMADQTAPHVLLAELL